MATGKKFKNALAKIDSTKRYALDEACKLLPETKIAKFDESVDIAVRLGVDPKHADQMVRGAVVLPHGTGKSQRVIVVAKGDKANEARAAGADAVGAEDLVEKIQKENWTEFDSMVATPDMMGLVGRLGRILVRFWIRSIDPASIPLDHQRTLKHRMNTGFQEQWNTVYRHFCRRKKKAAH